MFRRIQPHDLRFQNSPVQREEKDEKYKGEMSAVPHIVRSHRRCDLGRFVPQSVLVSVRCFAVALGVYIFEGFEETQRLLFGGYADHVGFADKNDEQGVRDVEPGTGKDQHCQREYKELRRIRFTFRHPETAHFAELRGNEGEGGTVDRRQRGKGTGIGRGTT